MLKKRIHISRAVVDMPADNPEGTMHRFAAGLRRVVAAPKPSKRPRRHKSKH